MKRKEAIEKIIGDYANDLGISRDFCYVFEHPTSGASSITIRFKDEWLNNVLLKGDVKSFSCFGILKNLEEEVRAYLEGITLYLFANKHGELYVLNNVIDSGDHVYVMLNGNYYNNSDLHIYKLLEKTGATCQLNIWKIDKKALLAYYMFYDNGMI